MTFDTGDQTLAALIEQAIKTANVSGVAGFTNPVMTADQYSPTVAGISPTIGQDFNRDLAIAIVSAMRQNTRLLVCTLGNLPPVVEGGVCFVRDGAGGAACLAFSDGNSWLRSDTLSVVG